MNNLISIRTYKIIRNSLIFCTGVLVLLSAHPVTAQEVSGNSQPYGIAAKRPVFAGACHNCPYGTMANVVKDAMKPYGYDVQICYRCSTTTGVRQIAGALVPPQPGPNQTVSDPVPTGPVDFGGANAIVLHRAYHGVAGRGDFDKDGPRPNLRVFAMISYPLYTIVAATKTSGITDLAQLKGRDKPLHVIADHHRSMEILAYYGLTEESITKAGGSIRSANNLDERVDLVIWDGTLSNAPEQDVWYQVTQMYDMVFLQMSDDLITQLAKAPGYERRTMPLGLLRGVDRNIPTVSRSDYPIIGRDDAPDDFAYTVAKALDEQSDLWLWAPIPMSYNPNKAWQTNGIPLHPGAERYYREKGYMR